MAKKRTAKDAVQCKDCQRVIYRKDGDRHGLCVFCRPPKTVGEMWVRFKALRDEVKALSREVTRVSATTYNATRPQQRTPSDAATLEKVVKMLVDKLG